MLASFRIARVRSLGAMCIHTALSNIKSKLTSNFVTERLEIISKELSDVVKNGGFNLVLAGKESIDYNGGMVPGMIAGLTNSNFVNNCISLEVEANSAKVTREIDGGKETVSANLPLIIGGQKGIVEESDLRIPNMRGIMMARQKPLTVLEPIDIAPETASVKFEKPATKGAVKLVSADNLDELISLLHNEAKVI